MPRPKSAAPTAGELEVLKILWRRGPSTAREIWEVLDRQRARHYTSANSLLSVMTDKGYLKRRKRGRAFLYEAKADRKKTARRLVRDLASRLFEGSTTALVVQALEGCEPSAAEMDEIARVIREYREKRDKP